MGDNKSIEPVMNNGYFLDERFVIKDGKTHPVAIICPGGGYEIVASFVEGTPIAEVLNKQGISAFIVHYRVKPEARFPAPMDDLARAVKAVFEKAEEYHLDMRTYSVWGSSAGGHLAASFGIAQTGYQKYGLPKPRTIVLLYPVVSMRRALAHLGSRQNLLGDNPPEDLIRLTSIDENVTPDYPPCYFWCGKNDKTVNPENAVRLDKALAQAGVAHSFTLYENAPHGVGIGTGTDAEGWISSAVAFWMKQTTCNRLQN